MELFFNFIIFIKNVILILSMRNTCKAMLIKLYIFLFDKDIPIVSRDIKY